VEPKQDDNVSSKHLLTKHASSNVYYGIGFEIAEEELFDMNAKHYSPWEAKFVVGLTFTSFESWLMTKMENLMSCCYRSCMVSNLG
jgi:hypothetical protein